MYNHSQGGNVRDQRSVRFGYHWGVSRQIDRIGRAIENGRNISDQIHYLRALAWPFIKEDQDFIQDWRELKDRVQEEMEGRKQEEQIRKLRFEQLNLLIDIFYRNGLLVDEGIPVEQIQVLMGDG